MKRYIALILCIIISVLFCSCTDFTLIGFESKKETETEKSKKPEPKEIGSLDPELNTEIYNKNGITVTADSYYIDSQGDAVISCTATNNTDETIHVAFKHPEINGICSAGDSKWGEAKEGQTITCALEVDAAFLSLAGITEINKYAFRFTIYNENGRTISDKENQYLCFTADNNDHEQSVNKEGTSIIDTEECKIIIQQTQNGKEGLDVVACFINDTDHTLNYQVSNAVINGINFDVNFLDTFTELPAYSITYSTFTIFDSDLNKNGVSKDSITRMDITAAVYNVLEEVVASCEAKRVEF
ncbi:MAG: hypothetical protein E7652_09275 [Ruminococcaceae bacterium]|nr:hypothetical protein [Oscillospiraceae bacterium]